jgi:hypothetical protein
MLFTVGAALHDCFLTGSLICTCQKWDLSDIEIERMKSGIARSLSIFSLNNLGSRELNTVCANIRDCG